MAEDSSCSLISRSPTWLSVSWHHISIWRQSKCLKSEKSKVACDSQIISLKITIKQVIDVFLLKRRQCVQKLFLENSDIKKKKSFITTQYLTNGMPIIFKFMMLNSWVWEYIRWDKLYSDMVEKYFVLCCAAQMVFSICLYGMCSRSGILWCVRDMVFCDVLETWYSGMS